MALSFDQPLSVPVLEPVAQVTASKKRRVVKIVRELARRRIEALKIYEPLLHIEPFHACGAPERILRGSNRSGKTLAAAIECARCVTGQDPYGKYPTENGRCFIVGKDGKHNSEVLFRKLFRPNAFRMIKDLNNGCWRTYRPWLKTDFDRESETKAAPPLIPNRMVQDIAWENKKDSLPNKVTLKNGWEIRFLSSLAKPIQGVDVDLVWFDEEIADPDWYNEAAARLIDRRGKFYWSATAQLGGIQLYELCQNADMLRHNKNARIREYFAHIDANPHFTDEQRDLFFEKMSEEERRIRIEGEFAFTSFRVYPEFSMATHGVDFFQIPNDWCRYMVVDPGRQVCAVLFAAVPPPKTGDEDEVYFYDELYIKTCDSKKFGEEVKRKIGEQWFHAFLIDHHGGRISESGSGNTVELQYSAELKKQDIASSITGNGFIWGSDDVQGGINAFRSWLTIRRERGTKLRVLKEACPNLEYEFGRYHYKRQHGRLTDTVEKRNDHLLDAARYLAMYDPKWHPKPKKTGSKSNVINYLREKARRKAEKEGRDHIRLGPGTGMRP